MARFNRYIRKITSDYWRDKFKPADLLRVFSHIQSILCARLDEYLLGEYDLLNLDIHTVGTTRVWVQTNFIFYKELTSEYEYYKYVYNIDKYWLDVDAIYDHHIDPEIKLQNNIDFVYDGDGVIRFKDKLPDQLSTPLYISKGHWAGYRIQKAIGDLLGYCRIDSVFYRDAIAVVLNPFYNGPTYEALLALWNVILGIPVVKYGDEKVIRIVGNKVITDKYTYDLKKAKPNVVKGDVLKRFQVLTDAVEFITHKTEPFWWEDRPAELFQKYLVSGPEESTAQESGLITRDARDYIMETFLFDAVVSIKINGQYVNMQDFANCADLVYLFYEALPTRTDPILSQSYYLESFDEILDEGFIMDTPDEESSTEIDISGDVVHKGDGNGTGTGNIDDIEDPDDPLEQTYVITGILTPKSDNFKTMLHIGSIYGNMCKDYSDIAVTNSMYIYSPDIGRPLVAYEREDVNSVSSSSDLALKLDNYQWHIFDRDQDFKEDFDLYTWEQEEEFVLDESYKDIAHSNFYEFWKEKCTDMSFVEPTYSKVFCLLTDNPRIKKQIFHVRKDTFTGSVDENGLAILSTDKDNTVDYIDSSELVTYKREQADYEDSFGKKFYYTGRLGTYNAGYSYATYNIHGKEEDTSSTIIDKSDTPLVSDIGKDPLLNIHEEDMIINTTGTAPSVNPSNTSHGFHDQGIHANLIQSHYKFGLGTIMWWKDKSEDSLTYTMDGITLVGNEPGYLISPEIPLGGVSKDIVWDMSLRLQEGSSIKIDYSLNYGICDNESSIVWNTVSEEDIDIVEYESTTLTDSHNLYWNGTISNVSGKIWIRFRLIPKEYNAPTLSSVGLVLKMK